MLTGGRTIGTLIRCKELRQAIYPALPKEMFLMPKYNYQQVVLFSYCLLALAQTWIFLAENVSTVVQLDYHAIGMIILL